MTEEPNNSTSDHSFPNAAAHGSTSSLGPSSSSDPFGYYYEDGYATSQDYVTAAIPVCIAFLSLLGCYIVIRESYAEYMLFTKRRGLGNPSNTGSVALALQNLATASFYFMYGFALVWGPLPAPKEIDFSWARGNTVTCSVQGFFTQMGIMMAALLQSSISGAYVLMVKFSWQDQRLWKLLRRANVIFLLIALPMSIYPAVTGNYNYNGETKCWINSVPYMCESKAHPDVGCIRGAHAAQLQMIYFLVPYWPLVVFNIVALCQIWCAVRSLEDLTTRYAGASSLSGPTLPPASRRSSFESVLSEVSSRATVVVSVNRSKSKAIASYAMLLISSFLISFGMSSFEVVFEVVTGYSPQWLVHISNAFIASPGLIFFLVFCNPRDENSMKTVEGRWTRRYVLGCFYHAWNRFLDIVVPDRTKTHVSVSVDGLSRASTGLARRPPADHMMLPVDISSLILAIDQWKLESEDDGEASAVPIGGDRPVVACAMKQTESSQQPQSSDQMILVPATEVPSLEECVVCKSMAGNVDATPEDTHEPLRMERTEQRSFHDQMTPISLPAAQQTGTEALVEEGKEESKVQPYHEQTTELASPEEQLPKVVTDDGQGNMKP